MGKIKELTLEAEHGAIPILHIECHGSSDKNGIVLKDNTFISWHELKPLLIDLNIATRLNLIVVLSACYGAHFGKVMDPTDRAPCLGLIGPTDTVSPIELKDGFSRFYRILLDELDGGPALKSLSEEKLNDGEYYFVSASYFFMKCFKRYTDSLKSSKEVRERAKRIQKRAKKAKLQPIVSLNQIERKVRSSSADYFEKYKKIYFMIDKYQENSERFNYTYESVKEFTN